MSKTSVTVVKEAPATANTRVRIVRDEGFNPREELDNVFHLYFNSRYFCSDKDAIDPRELNLNETFILPVYGLVHSGATVSLSPFNDPWDSGLAGFIYVGKKEFCEKTGFAEFTEEEARRFAGYELADYDTCCLRGDVFGYVRESWNDATRSWEVEDSCYGYYGEHGIHDALVDAGAFTDAEEIPVIDCACAYMPDVIEL